MTNETIPADWARSRMIALCEEFDERPSQAFARYIEAHEKPPVDRKLLCAREARARGRYCSESSQRYWRSGVWDHQLESHLQAITLWEEGFGQ